LGCWRAALLAAAAGALAPGCRASNTLEGSLGEIVDLTFTDTEVAVTGSEVILSYYRPNGAARDVVFKLVVNIAPKDVPPGRELDLAPRPDGTANATCTRAVAGDPIHLYAAVRIGSLEMDQVPVVDGEASGSFRVTLGVGGDAGRGRTAFGNFQVDHVAQGN
jgi:hypothetical protein